GHIGHTTHACRDTRDLVQLTRLKVHPEDVAEAFRVRDEIQAPAVGRVLRVDVLDAGERLEQLALTRLDVDDRKTLVPEDERLEIRVRALVRRVHELAAVGREVRMQVRVPVIRQLTYLARLDVHQEQVA